MTKPKHPCEVCGTAISAARVGAAISRGHQPTYCDNPKCTETGKKRKLRAKQRTENQ